MTDPQFVGNKRLFGTCGRPKYWEAAEIQFSTSCLDKHSKNISPKYQTSVIRLGGEKKKKKSNTVAAKNGRNKKCEQFKRKQDVNLFVAQQQSQSEGFRFGTDKN